MSQVVVSGSTNTKRIGSRGCPACGSHNTERLPRRDSGHQGAQWCIACKTRWVPCTAGCRGYRLNFDNAKLGPMIIGCPGCEVPDPIARRWPEAYRAMARVLDGNKKEDLDE